jgi:hypothetical protein
MLLATFKTQPIGKQQPCDHKGAFKRRELIQQKKKIDERRNAHWLFGKDGKLLQNITLLDGIKADVVVAKDGSGKYKKISDALKAVPEKSKKRFVIYVKKGIYNENLRIEKPMECHDDWPWH